MSVALSAEGAEIDGVTQVLISGVEAASETPEETVLAWAYV